MSTLRNIRRKIAPLKRRWLHGSRRPKSENYDSSTSVILASAGRSGSTWIDRTLNWNHAYRSMFEPFHGRWVREFQGLPRYHYLDDSNCDPLAEPIRDVVQGRTDNPWVDQYNLCSTAEKRIIKAVRANLMLPHIHRSHPEVRLILVMRHPFSQALSAITGGWKLAPEMFLRQQPLMNRYPEMRSILDAAVADPFASAVLAWSVVHWVPLRELTATEMKLVFYESLVQSPEPEFEAIFAYLGEPFDHRALVNVEAPSKTARSNESFANERLSRWKSKLSVQQIENGLTILRCFGLDSIYEESPLPLVESQACFRLATQAELAVTS